ncbi:peptidoglycan-binding domain-containing protein [Cucumibacter marinus]|uniref:peptidoglycan-binding domain-containing protein n=1 Tax=Cucumibacter marinus TaxID=1121252 RepID=UPI0003FCC795|nr:hypothetical protein [Cucumibacter marinus]
MADTRCVQAFLAETAFDPGPVDGLWGGKTETALENAFDQLDRTVEGGTGRNNTDEICALFSGAEADDIRERLAYRFYPIELADGAGSGNSPTDYDFSGIDVATGYSADRCTFEIRRHLFSEPEAVNVMANGDLVIEEGRVRFVRTRWRVGGFSGPDDLIEQSNLAIRSDGQVVGRMIYYERYIPDGEVFEPPIYVTLPAHFDKTDGPVANGHTYFNANSWSEGSLRISCRKEAPPEFRFATASLAEVHREQNFVAYRLKLGGTRIGDDFRIYPDVIIFTDYNGSADETGNLMLFRLVFQRDALQQPESREADYLECGEVAANVQGDGQQLKLHVGNQSERNECLLAKMGKTDRIAWQAVIDNLEAILARAGRGPASERVRELYAFARGG